MTRRQLRRREVRARTLQHIRKNPEWAQRKIIRCLLRRPDHRMDGFQLLAAFRIGPPKDGLAMGPAYMALSTALHRLVAAKQLHFMGDAESYFVVRLRASEWLRHARSQMEKAPVS